MRRRRALAGAVALSVAAVAALATLPSAARAGQWMQVSCVNPDGSPAPSQGWSASASAVTGARSTATTSCTPTTPLSVALSAFETTPVGAQELLTFTPPAGSTLVGGSVAVTLSAPATGGGAFAAARVYEPSPVAGDAQLTCMASQSPCDGFGNGEDLTYRLAPDLGGTLSVSAECDGNAGAQCDQGPSYQTIRALAYVHSAQLLLQTASIPAASGFGGTALARTVHGDAHLLLTATDPSGPGVYQVGVAVDGHPFYAQTPDVNNGACVPVGTDPVSGALMFDVAQPCPAAVPVAATIPTEQLGDGDHELTVAVTDAARDSATVLDQEIHVSNPRETPRPRRGIRARFLISWRWQGKRTTLRTISVRSLPRHGRVRFSCAPASRRRRCPRQRIHSATTGSVGRLLRSLRGDRFTAGTRLRLVVSAPHRRSERVELRIRDGRAPRARLLSH